MAWNEPGGGRNKNQDPWRGGNNDQGPPELDELFRKLQDKLGGIMGGKGGGSGSGGGNTGGLIPLLMIVAILSGIIWGVYGVYRVEEAEQAVVLRFGKFHRIVTAGLQWNPPLVDEVLKVNTEQISSLTHKSTMLTEDQNIVDVQLEVQYRVQSPKDFFLEINDAVASLRQATESALRHVVGGSEMDQVITEGRYLLASDVKTKIQKYLDLYSSGLLITKVNVEDAHPPKEVKAAFDDVIKAKEDEVRLKNEAEAYSNGVIPIARGNAQRQLEEANAYKEEIIARATGEADRFTHLLAEYRKAPDVTRQRLYLETMEQVLTNTTKVLVSVESGNNLLYLPLDKMMDRDAKGSVGNIPLTSGAVSTLTSEADRLRSRREGRRREGRQ